MSDTGHTGTGMYLAFKGIVLSTNYRTTSGSEDVGTVDQSAGADTAATYLTTLTNGTRQATIKHKAGDTAIWGAVALKEEGTLEWGEEGTAAGKPRHYVNAISVNRSDDASHADLVVISAQWKFSGAVTDGTY